MWVKVMLLEIGLAVSEAGFELTQPKLVLMLTLLSKMRYLTIRRLACKK